jgi:hypothetical protein
MSDDFDSLDAREKAAAEAALNRCRALAGQIEMILCNERRHFIDEISLADFYASLERLPMSSDIKADSRSRTHLLP